MRIVVLLSVLILASCSTTPPPDSITNVPVNDISLAEVNQDFEQFAQSPVRWGGRILKATPETESSVAPLIIEILEYPLDEKGIPDPTQSSGGRFIAKLPAPYKLGDYRRNRLVTVAGQLIEERSYPLAKEQQQKLPVLEVQDTHKWARKKRPEESHSHGWWPRFFFGIGFRSDNVGVGVVFH